MKDLQFVYETNAVGTKWLCAIVDHTNKMVHIEQDRSLAIIVDWAVKNNCLESLKKGYSKVYRDLDFYVQDNNLVESL